MVLSMHQPNFIPWIGLFEKIQNSDIFIILDSVQYPRGKSVANRNLIKCSHGKTELVVPISKPKGNKGKITYQEVNFAEKNWHVKILKTIKNCYSKTPCFDKYYTYLNELFLYENFCEMNVEFIRFVMNELNISTKVVRLSSVDEINGEKNELIIDLCKKLNATTYLSGQGAKKYIDQELFVSNNINLIYQDYKLTPYEQLYGDFIPNLSVIDLLFNCSKLDYSF